MNREDRELMFRDVITLEREMERQQSREGPRFSNSTNDVGNPPTDAQLDAAFGTPTAIGDGFIGVIDDNNAHTNFWLCATINGYWTTVSMTKAV